MTILTVRLLSSGVVWGNTGEKKEDIKTRKD